MCFRRPSWWWPPAWGPKSSSQYSCNQAVCGRRSTVPKCFRSCRNNTHIFSMQLLWSPSLISIRAHLSSWWSKGTTGTYSRQNMWPKQNPPSKRVSSSASWTRTVKTLWWELCLSPQCNTRPGRAESEYNCEFRDNQSRVKSRVYKQYKGSSIKRWF